MNRIVILLLALLPFGSLAQSKLMGTWNGEIDLGMQKLPLVIHLADSAGTVVATLDSPLQGAKGIPANATIDGENLKVELPMLMASYDGILRDGTIEGKFTQQGHSFALNLTPGDYVPERPQTPKSPFPYVTEDVQFVNPTDSAVLSGTLTYPIALPFKSKKKAPVVVMVTGSGLQNRDEEVFGHKPFAVWAHQLALNGIASLRYDDRDCGKSTGNSDDATTATFVADAKAAIDMLRQLDKFGSVGVMGHSEGGTIAFIIAGDGAVDFAVSLAGTAVPGDQVLVDQNVRILKTMGLDAMVADEYGVGLGRLFDYMKKNPDAKQWNEIDEALADLTRLSAELKGNLQEIISSEGPWMHFFLNYDPTVAISKIQVPVMAVNGELDCQVNCDMNLNAIRNKLQENAKSEIKSYPGLNHLFQHARTGLINEYGEIDETISPEVIADVVNWILKVQD